MSKFQHNTRSITRASLKMTLQGLEGSVPKVSMGSSSFSSYFIGKDIQEGLNGFRCLIPYSFSSYFLGKDIQEGLNGFCLFNGLQFLVVIF